jgi:hypothetical protein
LTRAAEIKTNPRKERITMSSKNMIAILLITLGVVVLAYAGISFKTPGKPINILGMHIETTGRHYISPVVGSLALVGGILLLVVKPKRV